MPVAAAGVDDSLDLEFRVVTEVDEQSKLDFRRFEIVLHLGSVLIRQVLHGLEFEDDLLVADEVRLVSSSQRSGLVVECQRLLRDERNSLEAQLNLDALLIDRFQKPAALFPVYIETCPNAGSLRRLSSH